MTGSLENHKVVSKNEWLKARKILLNKEKEFTVLRDQLSQAQRDLPWTAVHKEYVFEGPNGKETLSELFDGRSHRLYHFMFDRPGRRDVRAAPFGLTISIKLWCT